MAGAGWWLCRVTDEEKGVLDEQSGQVYHGPGWLSLPHGLVFGFKNCPPYFALPPLTVSFSLDPKHPVCPHLRAFALAVHGSLLLFLASSRDMTVKGAHPCRQAVAVSHAGITPCIWGQNAFLHSLSLAQTPKPMGPRPSNRTRRSSYIFPSLN
ncbi:hypothetical protein TREES_T100012279 [Tupaia chinensis]|uniref:Uncharacterized protein n=1 Tax=Tupaia chinensis TaxID=246437 RepID=L9JJG0_TUPCH|nr:hypothetical protein TREES_T100012279 [Tupaia chinensis]